MNARRDSLAHRFVARTLDETRRWPAELQVTWHQHAFQTLPELILELDEPAACRFARSWRERYEAELAGGAAEPFTDDERAWVAELARGHVPHVAGIARPGEVARLADVLRRFGPLALALPWRNEPPAKA